METSFVEVMLQGFGSEVVQMDISVTSRIQSQRCALHKAVNYLHH